MNLDVPFIYSIHFRMDVVSKSHENAQIERQATRPRPRVDPMQTTESRFTTAPMVPCRPLGASKAPDPEGPDPDISLVPNATIDTVFEPKVRNDKVFLPSGLLEEESVYHMEVSKNRVP